MYDMKRMTKDSEDADEGKSKGRGEEPGRVGHRVDQVLLGSFPQSHWLLQSWYANIDGDEESLMIFDKLGVIALFQGIEGYVS